MTSRAKRGSRRVLLNITLIVWVKLEGSAVQFRAETVDVGLEGAKIRTTTPLQTGFRLRVAALEPYRFARARVVWANPEAREYGVHLEKPGNFWGVCFPPDDWHEPSAIPPGPVAADGLPVTGPSIMSASASGAGAITASAAGERPVIPAEGTKAIISGMSTIRMPFQESGLLMRATPDEASMLVRPSVDPGAALRVIIGNTIFKASIRSVSRQREQGKWRVWLRFG